MRASRTIGATILLLPLLVGCPKRPHQTNIMKSTGVVDVSAAELRLRVRGLAPRMASIISGAANEIRDATDDPAVRHAALRWKISGIPAGSQAVYHQDPLVALVDTYAFAIQQREYFETGAGSEWFGPQQPIALQAARQLEGGVEQVILIVSNPDGIVRLEDRLDDWTAQYPIEGPNFGRESVSTHLAALAAATKVGAFASVGSLTSDVADLAARIDLFADQIPNQMRWQSEYLLEEYIPRHDLEALLGDVNVLRETLGPAGDVVAGIPDLMEGATSDVDSMVQRERSVLLTELDHQLQGTLEHLTGERVALIEEVERERELILAAIRSEREIVLTALRQERVATVEDVEAVAGRLFDQMDGKAISAIDHLMYRLAQLVLGTLVLVGLGAFLFLRALRRSPTAA